ncbi:hypothetical protein EDD15DRAFT_2182588 [Pisolithus albus]|nr:hypothetical protein EDD15DRAFT_2182588 [Pisolithus albus]
MANEGRGATAALQKFLICEDLHRHFFSYCNVADLQQLACTNWRQSGNVRAYLRHRITTVGALYFENGKDLFDMLRTFDAVISGSTALHLLLPKRGTSWTPNDLDLYVPLHTSVELLQRLQWEGYAIASQHPTNVAHYSYSHVHEVVVLCKGQRKIDMVISKTATALSPIFQFHSTAVMNFVSADTVFCSYPRLTLQGLSMVNAGPLYCSPDKRVILDAVRKYQACGIRYIHCKDYHGVKNTCKVSTRTLTDSAMMRMNIHGLPSTSQTFLDVFWQFGILDLQWILGGMPCGLESAFCRPRVEVIEEESYESLFVPSAIN